MKNLRKRFHDVGNKIHGAYGAIGFIEDILKDAKQKNKAVDIDQILSTTKIAIDSLNKSNVELAAIKRIAYKFCNPEEDYDHLIFLNKDKKVLITDENEGVIAAFKSLLSSMDETKLATAFFASNIKECKEILDREKPSLTFLDLDMCGSSPADGLQILNEYKGRLRIIAIGEEENKNVCLGAGAVRFISKPVERDTYIGLMLDNA